MDRNFNSSPEAPAKFTEPGPGAVGNQPLWRGNFSVWWLIGSVYSIWFTVWRGIPAMVERPTPLFVVHIINACLISWICIVNLFHTPSHGPKYRVAHKLLGRIALVTGILSTLFGYVTVWYERYKGPTPFAIGVTIGGTLQVLMQLLAVYKIRRNNVKAHTKYNFAAFYGGCLIPGIMRLPHLIPAPFPDSWEAFSWMFPLLLGALALNAKLRDRWF